MLPRDVTELREELGWSIGELARALGVSASEVADWEAGERFPTKRAVERMGKLRTRTEVEAPPPAAVAAHHAPATPSPWAALAEPDLWRLVRKLVASPELRQQVARLAEDYPDPADPDA